MCKFWKVNGYRTERRDGESSQAIGDVSWQIGRYAISRGRANKRMQPTAYRAAFQVSWRLRRAPR